MAGIARFLNLGFGTDQFWQVWGSEAQGYIYAAWVEEENAKEERRKDIFRPLFWIGNILSDGMTGVMNALGAKLTRTLGEIHLPKEWREIKEEADREKKKEGRDPKKWISLQ